MKSERRYDYGQFCKSQAEPGFFSCAGSNPEDWCEDEWCYVDPCSCSGFAFEPSDYFPGEGLFYSYDVCRQADVDAKCAALADMQSCYGDSECAFVGGNCTSALRPTLSDSSGLN